MGDAPARTELKVTTGPIRGRLTSGATVSARTAAAEMNTQANVPANSATKARGDMSASLPQPGKLVNLD